MSVIAGTELINQAALLLFDVPNINWSRTEWLSYLNDGQRAIAMISPTSTSKISSVALVAGARQKLPADGWMLLDVIRNMGTTGATPGQAIRPISRRLLDAFSPLWQTSPASALTAEFIFNLSDQTAFFVNPPSTGTNYVEINYSQVPPELTSESSVIEVSDVLAGTLVNYMLFRAASKTASFSPGATAAAAYLNLFNMALGAKATAEQANNPDLGLSPPSVEVRGGES